MRNLSQVEIISLTTLLKSEKDSLTMSRAMQTLISDEQLRKLGEAGILAMEGRIRGIQQFISENQLTETGEVY